VAKKSEIANEAPERSAQTKQEGSRSASLTIKFAIFLIPAIVGFVVAYAILQVMSPFLSIPEWLIWIVIAIVVSLATSLFVGDVTRNAIRDTKLFRKANRFDTEVGELFGSALRDGSAKSAKKNAIKMGQDAEFVDELLRLLDQLKRHDRLTRGHIERVRAYASMIGRELNMSDEDLEALNWSAVMHDIGKLDVPNWLLSSPEKPTDDEWEILKRHPEASRHRLRRLEKFLGPSIYDGALYHHERWDGNGYPNGVAGEEIPIIGRITAIADAFDVMTHARSYKKPMPIALAREELMAGAGSQFDPKLVTAFLKIGDEELKDVRGWSATIAGISVVGSRVATIGTQLSIVAASVAGAGVASVTADTIPPAIAFEQSPATSTTTAAPTTTTAAPTTTTPPTTTTTTTTTTIATTTTAQRLMSVIYEIGNHTIDDVEVTLENADELQVFLDGEPFETFELEEAPTPPPSSCSNTRSFLAGAGNTRAVNLRAAINGTDHRSHGAGCYVGVDTAAPEVRSVDLHLDEGDRDRVAARAL